MTLVATTGLIGYMFVGVVHGFAIIDAVLLFVALFGAVIPFYARETQLRGHFEALLLAGSRKNDAAREMIVYHALLEMLIPPALVDPITKKVEGEATYNQLIQWLSDVCVASVSLAPMRIADVASKVAIDALQNATDAVDAALLASEGLLEKFRSVGDTFYVAGPIVLPENVRQEQADDDNNESEFSKQRRRGPVLRLDTHEDVLFKTTVVLLDFISFLERRFRGRLTSIINCSSSFVAVVGKTRPSFDLMGTAVRSVTATHHAAPTGYIGVMYSFLRILGAGGVKLPRHANDFTLGPTEAWALRGAGTQRIRRLRQASSVRGPPQAQIEGAAMGVEGTSETL